MTRRTESAKAEYFQVAGKIKNSHRMDSSHSKTNNHTSLKSIPTLDGKSKTLCYSGSRPKSASRKSDEPPTRMLRNLPIDAVDHVVMPATPPSQMLQLMRLSRGLMKGDLWHRRGYGLLWSSAHVWINPDHGSLRYAVPLSTQSELDLVEDLRGCSVQATFDPEENCAILHVSSLNLNNVVQIRPKDEYYFNAWFAALLCWHPMCPGQKLHSTLRLEHPTPVRSNKEPTWDSAAGDANTAQSIIKFGKAYLIDAQDDTSDLSLLKASLKQSKEHSHDLRNESTRVSVVLRLNREFSLYASSDDTALATIKLSELPRSAIQRVHHSMIGLDSAFAVYPQYAASHQASTRLRPVYLSFSSREMFETWFVLLRALAIPELYGNGSIGAPESANQSEILPGLDPEAGSDVFRLEKSLQISVNQVKLSSADLAQDFDMFGRRQSEPYIREKGTITDFQALISIDGQIRAKTSVKSGCAEPYWFETFEFNDCGSAFSNLTVRLSKRTTPDRPTKAPLTYGAEAASGSPKVSALNQQLAEECISAEAIVELHNIDRGKDWTQWWALRDITGTEIGTISLKVRYDHEFILLDREYDNLSAMLLNFPNNLTIQIFERLPSELTRVSQHLLNIFQVSGKALEWLKALAEEEVDGTRENARSARKVARRLESRESMKSSFESGEREKILRGMGKSATEEANLLFRGNSLLSKALEAHMKRLGRHYLDTTIGSKIREICVDDVQCEVDPSKLAPGQLLQSNWTLLKKLTNEIWDCIRKSASSCPHELRLIYRFIQAVAKDRYGDYSRIVAYSSVSGFLFLRFFCAATLNPQLYGLIKGKGPPWSVKIPRLTA